MKKVSFFLSQFLIVALLAWPTGVGLASNEPQHVCPGPAGPDSARCHAVARPNASTSPTGLSPDTIKSVYGFSTDLGAGAGKTIAIVDAYNDPTAESDLAVFSSQYGRSEEHTSELQSPTNIVCRLLLEKK